MTARGVPVKRIPTPAAQPGATASATFAVRVFITSDLTPHRFSALVIKPGWQWDDFMEAASAKLSGGALPTPSPRGGGGGGGVGVPGSMMASSLTPTNAVFVANGAEIGSLDDLREDDQILLRFQKRISISSTSIPTLNIPAGGGIGGGSATAPLARSNSSDLIESASSDVGADSARGLAHGDDEPFSYIPMDGVFRLLLPELADVSPLSFSDELVADLVQDELKRLTADSSSVNSISSAASSLTAPLASPTSTSSSTTTTTPAPASPAPDAGDTASSSASPAPAGTSINNHKDKISLRFLFRNLIISDSFTDTLLHTYDYLIPHHTFLAILIVHLRAPLVPMEAVQGNVGANVPVRPQPPTRPAQVSGGLPTFGMSVQMTDPIKRGAAQTRIVNVIKRWIETRFTSVQDDLSVVELLDELVVYLISSPERLRCYGETIAQTLKMARKQHLQTIRNLELSEQELLTKDRVGYVKAIEVTPFKLACQLTIADQNYFQRIRLVELQALQFDSANQSLAPHIIHWVNHSSFITSWVVASILGPPGEPNPGPKRRAIVIGHFISAMDELRSMKSYNAMMQIYHALNHPAIERLEATWESVAVKHKSVKDAVAEMIKPPSSHGYHTLIQQVEAPAIPYIEHHLNELRHIEEAETILEDGVLNYAKLERISKSMRSVLRLQSSTYDLVPNSAYMSFIKTYDVPSMTTLVELSLSLEADSAATNAAAGTNAPGRIVVRPTVARTTSDIRNNSLPEAVSVAASSSAAASAASLGSGSSKLKPLSSKDRKRKDSSAQKLAKAADKEEEKRKKKWDKQAKKIRPLLTAALSLEQGILNSDIYEQFLSYSGDAAFINALQFYKSAVEFKRMFGSDAEPAARRTREEASKIATAHLAAGSERMVAFSSKLETQLKEIDTKARSETGLFTNSIFDPLMVEVAKMLSTAFVLFKAQRTSAASS